MEKDKISVLVVNINTLNYTKNCISDLLNQTYKNFDILLIDQNSVEIGTLEYLESLKKINNIKIIKNNDNKPLNWIWNEFYLESNSQYLCYLNNDVKLTDNFIEDTINILDKEKNVGIFIHTTNSFKFNNKLNNLKYVISENKIKQGWDFTIRKSDYTLIPKELLFYFGDDWLFHNVYEKNHKCAICLSSPIIHYGSKSSFNLPIKIKDDEKNFHKLGFKKYLPHYNYYNEVYPTFYNFGENKIRTIVYKKSKDIPKNLTKYCIDDNINHLIKKYLNLNLKDSLKIQISKIINEFLLLNYNKIVVTENENFKYIIDHLPNKNYANMNDITENYQKEKLTILIPFMNREENLKVFVPYMHNYMKNYFPEVIYDIVVVEQVNDKPFNKGILFNAGFVLTSGNTDYYALHDVDELPISSNYRYNDKPFHLCVNVYNQSNNGQLLNEYEGGFKHRGGCFLINKNLYIKANGHSNLYWGWGCIDINFSFRLDWINNCFNRYGKNNELCHYVSLNANTKRFSDDPHYNDNDIIEKKTINGEIDWKLDGLNNLNFELLEKVISDEYIKYKITF